MITQKFELASWQSNRWMNRNP